MLSHLSYTHSSQMSDKVDERKAKSKRKPKNTTRNDRKVTVRIGRHEKEAMNRRVTQKHFDIESTEDIQCIGEVLDFARNRIVKQHIKKYRNEKGSLKFIMKLLVYMHKPLSEKQTLEEIWLNSNCEELESLHQFDSVYNNMCKKVWEEFENISTNGSGWVIKNISGIRIGTYAHNPLKIGCDSFINVPTQIRNSMTTVNVRGSKKSDCFKYAVLCSAFYPRIKKKQKQDTSLRPSEVSTYTKLDLISKLNFEEIESPLPSLNEKHFATFERNNPKYALNITRLKVSEDVTKKKVSRKSLERRRFNILPQRSSTHSERIQLHILNLYNPKTLHSHFVAVTNISKLISHCSAAKPTTRLKFCFTCKYAFRGPNYKRNYRDHFVFCGKKIFSTNLTRTRAFRKMKHDHPSRNIRCTNCFSSFEGGSREAREKRLNDHKRYCKAKPTAIVDFPCEDFVTFTNYRRRRKKPFVIVGDFESILVSSEMKTKLENVINEIKKKLKTKEGSLEEDEILEFEGFESDDDITEEDDKHTFKNVYFDDTELPIDPPEQSKTLNTHLASSFSLQVITFDHLQHHFPTPSTYRGVDAGKEKLIIYYILCIF